MGDLLQGAAVPLLDGELPGPLESLTGLRLSPELDEAMAEGDVDRHPVGLGEEAESVLVGGEAELSLFEVGVREAEAGQVVVRHRREDLQVPFLAIDAHWIHDVSRTIASRRLTSPTWSFASIVSIAE